MFRIHVNVKQLGKRKLKIAECPIDLQNKPSNVKELIEQTAISLISDFNSKIKQGNMVEPLSEIDISNQSEIGKIAFGIQYSTKSVDMEKAVQTALQAFEDGLVRIFWKEDELTNLYEEILIKEEDVFIFIRLTMLVGGLYI